jgi:phage tail sheath protein FI
MASTYLNRSTPGVYITEIPAFGSSIVGVATAVPVFIGYTQYAGDPTTGASLYNTPVALTSMNDYNTYFGGAAQQNYSVAVINPPPTPTATGGGTAASVVPDFTAYYTPSGGGTAASPVLQGFSLDLAPDQPQFNLYWQMLMFFANGGGNCYVVSVGSYWSNQLPTGPTDTSSFLPGAIAADDLVAGITVAGFQSGPTMTVIPEACQLPPVGGVYEDYATVVQNMMTQAMTLQDRVAILDLPGALSANTFQDLETAQTNLWTSIGPSIAAASYAAAYGPALAASIVTTSNIVYTNLAAAEPANNALINNILTVQANQIYGQSPGQLATIQSAIAAAFPLTTANNNANNATQSDNGTAYPPLQPNQTLAQWQTSLDNLLQNSLPIFKQIEQQIANKMNVMAPSGAMAGIWTKSDNLNQVWNAPANIAVASVTAPLYNMNDVQQGGFNLPTNGQAIDVIRSQINRGTIVWGARTLDGNSNDYRYIQVRRTLIYIEQSIKLAMQPYVFAANDATTWSTVVAACSSFLDGMWQAGGLVGSKPTDAYSVACGVGSTMTQQNVLAGYMVVAVQVALVHPAEFIELTFTQMMGS